MTYDTVLSTHVGSFGRWQAAVFLFLTPIIIVNALLNMAQTFAFYESSFRCQVDLCDGVSGVGGAYDADFASYAVPLWNLEDPDEDELRTQSCTNYAYVGNVSVVGVDAEDVCTESDFDLDVTEICSSHIYDDSDFEYSLVAELDIGTCGDYEGWPLYPIITQTSLLSTATALGMFFGAFSLGIVSDKFGRQSVMIVCNFLSFLALLTAAYCNNYWAMFTIRFVHGIIGKGLFNLSVSLIMEISGINYRMYMGILVNIPFALGEMVTALLAFLFQDWSDFFLSLSLFALPWTLLWFVIPESPRWLIAKGNLDKGIKVLRKGAKMNKRPDFPDNLTEKDFFSDDFLFSSKTVSMITVVLWVNWIAAAVAYYGLSYVSVDLSDDIYVSFVLSALIEIPSYIADVLILDHIGRKTVLFASQLLSGVCCIWAAFVEEQWLVTTLSLAGKFGASSAFATVILYTAELYPTSLRATAVGTASTMGRIGSIAAPILAGINPVTVPLTIMGVTALVGGVLVLLLPEPLGQPFPETKEDVVALYRNSKPWYKWLTKAELKERQEMGMKLVNCKTES